MNLNTAPHLAQAASRPFARRCIYLTRQLRIIVSFSPDFEFSFSRNSGWKEVINVLVHFLYFLSVRREREKLFKVAAWTAIKSDICQDFRMSSHSEFECKKHVLLFITNQQNWWIVWFSNLQDSISMCFFLFFFLKLDWSVDQKTRNQHGCN